MEAGAIAYVCEQLKIPYLGVKSITDIVDGGRVTAEEFLEFETASQIFNIFISTPRKNLKFVEKTSAAHLLYLPVTSLWPSKGK